MTICEGTCSPASGTIRGHVNQRFTAFPSGNGIEIARDCSGFPRIKADSGVLFPRKSRNQSRMAYIRSNKYGFRAEVEKKGVRESRTFPTKRLAQEWANRRELEISANETVKRSYTFGELCDKYIEQITSKKAGKKWEQARIETFRAFFGDVPLSEVGQPQIAAWRDDRLKRVTGGTVLREKNILSNMFNVSRLEWHWHDLRPFDGVKMPKENEEREAVWRWQQIKRVLRYPCSGKTQEVIDLFHIALRTSLRLQECIAAPALFDKDRQVVVLPPEFNKTKRTDVVPIGRIGAKLLQRKPFTVEPNEASTLFADLTGRLGIDGLTFHDTRATALTYLARKVDVMRLAKISRHRDIRILQRRYYRERPEDISRLI